MIGALCFRLGHLGDREFLDGIRSRLSDPTAYFTVGELSRLMDLTPGPDPELNELLRGHTAPDEPLHGIGDLVATTLRNVPE